jgi:hypothetical protein
MAVGGAAMAFGFPNPNPHGQISVLPCSDPPTSAIIRAGWREPSGEHRFKFILSKERDMAESVYKVVELVGTSTESWEKAATAAVERAGQSLRDLRVAAVTEQDMVLKDGKVQAFRCKVKVSFKFEND